MCKHQLNKLILYLACLFLLCGCFPNFKPRTVECRHIDVEGGKFVLIREIGCLDQEFPSSVYFVNNDDSVLIYKGYAVKDLSVKADTLTVNVGGETLFSCPKIESYELKIISE